MIDRFDIIKLQDISIEDVADKLGITVKRHKGLCPFHDDSKPSLTFNTRKNRYRCYVCNASGGTIDLVMNTQNWKFNESCHWLANEFGIVLSETISNREFKKLKEQKKITKHYTLNTQQLIDVPYLERLMAQPILNAEAKNFLFKERKLDPEVISKLGISSISYNCPMSSSPKPSYYNGPALLIPYKDVDGKLVSVQARYLGKETVGEPVELPRFQFPKGSSCHVFNLPVLKELNDSEPLFITEGVTDCMAIMSAGFKAIAIPSATLLKPEDIDAIRYTLNTKHSSLHMYPDQDEPGQKLFFDLKALCPQLVYHQLPNGFKDVGQYYAFIHRDDK